MLNKWKIERNRIFLQQILTIQYYHHLFFRWVHDYQDACVDKVEKFLRGEKIPHMEKIPSQGSIQGDRDSRGSPGRNTPRNSMDGTL